MIAIGIDIVDVARFERLNNWSPKINQFLNEIESTEHNIEKAALRFAIFEAFWKALQNLSRLSLDETLINILGNRSLELIREYFSKSFGDSISVSDKVELLEILEEFRFQFTFSGSHDGGFAIAIVAIASKHA